jgi:hypothetical protein
VNKTLDRRTVIAGGAALAAPFVIGGRAGAAERAITVGTYTAQQGEYIRKQIIPPFEEMASVPGVRGVMLTFDDFVIGMEQFGTRILPLMQCRSGIRQAA